jgi:hypothetical protein
MALCTDCGTALLGSAKECPACGTLRHRTGAERGAAAVSVASISSIESEMAIAEVRLVTASVPREGRGLDHRRGRGAADAPLGPPPPSARSWAADHDLALCALVLGLVSVGFGLLGHGWFGIAAVACGYQARRQVADHGAARVARVLTITGVVLGSAAVVMTLGSVVSNPPWR